MIRASSVSYTHLDVYKRKTLHLSEQQAGQKVRIEIPELKIASEVQTDGQGMAKISFRAKKLERWSPQKPKFTKSLFPLQRTM